MTCLATNNANDLIGLMLGKTAANSRTNPVTWYAALCTSAPSAGSPGTEATGTSYARVAITNDTSTGFNTPSSGAVTNKNIITWTTAGGDWSSQANMVAVQLYDALTSGNAGPFATLTVAKPVFNGDTPSIAASALSFTLT